jgi:Right handed beta helix region
MRPPTEPTLSARHACAVFLLAMLLPAARPAAAVNSLCVADDGSLATALDSVQSSATVIKLVQGTYHLDHTVWNSNVSGTTIARIRLGSSLLGGYTTNCSSRDIAVGNTMITDNSNALYDEASILGDVTIEGISFNLKHGLAVYANANRDPPIAAGSQLLIRRNVFSGTLGSDALPLIVYWSEDTNLGGTIRLVNNLVHDNSSSDAPSFNPAAVFIKVSEGNPKVELINNTVMNNGGTLAGVAIKNYVPVAVYAYNNIFYGNGDKDLYLNLGDGLVLVDNVIGTHTYPPPAATPVGTTTGDPKVDASYHPIEAPLSPAINTGTDDVIGGLPATDLSGRDREVGSEPDRGAFESSINNSSSQSVTTTSDSPSPGSLRAAILSANATPGGATISFNLGSGCANPYVITLQTPLPEISRETHILGYTQPGSAPNDLDVGDDARICIILDGGANAIADGLTVPSSAADTIKVSIAGLAFSGFSHAALNLRGGSGHIVSGVHIGGMVGGVPLAPVGTGIILGPGVHDVTIGGQDDALRNIVGGGTVNGISVDRSSGSLGAAHDNQIVNNYLGVDWDTGGGFSNHGNAGSGVAVAGYNNTIQDNCIGFNTTQGVQLVAVDAHDNIVSGNLVGTSPNGDHQGNGFGVSIASDAHDNAISGNTIADNMSIGVGVASGQHNLISANSIHDNVGLGIDLGNDGVTTNDDDSAPPAGDPPNRLQNFPVLTAAIGGHGQGTVSGTLTSTGGDYTVEFFASPSCDDSGHGEGSTYLGQKVVRIPLILSGQETVSFSATIQSFFLQVPGEMITATATAHDPMNDTSEFSACFPYTDDTIFSNGFDGGLL